MKRWEHWYSNQMLQFWKQLIIEQISFVWRIIHRYILILTQTIKNTFLVKFSPTQLLASSGLLSQYCRWKKTHTNQYLAFDSHHPLHQKLGMPRTLLNRCEEIVTEEEDRKEERNTIKNALNICCYPDWTIKRVEENLRNKEENKGKGNNRKESSEKNKGMVVLPYVRGVSEELARIYKKRQITSAMKPHSTLRTILVHPKDKTDPKEGV